MNAIRALAVLIEHPPVVNLSPDPQDNYLLAMAMAGKAHYLVTGDKPDLLALAKIGGARIVTAATFVQERGIG